MLVAHPRYLVGVDLMRLQSAGGVLSGASGCLRLCTGSSAFVHAKGVPRRFRLCSGCFASDGNRPLGSTAPISPPARLRANQTMSDFFNGLEIVFGEEEWAWVRGACRECTAARGSELP